MDIQFSNNDHKQIYDAIKTPKNVSIAHQESANELLLQGDNLEALKYLIEKQDLRKKVKLVYIDPPFSTKTSFRVNTSGRTATISSSNKHEVAYHDNLSGEEYLDFIRQRLVFLKEIMADDASIYLHIDYKIGHYVKLLMDEVFGADAFKNDITRIKCNPKNFNRKAYGNIKDLILFYARGDFTWNDVHVKFTPKDIEKLFPKIDKNGERYTTNPLHAPGETSNGKSGEAWRGMMPPEGRHWRYAPDVLEQLEQDGLIEWSSNGVPRKKVYAKDRVKIGKKMQDIWEFKDPQYPKYPTEKNIELLKFIIESSSNPDDIVLDCFAGSGTTLVAAKQLGRNWIGIDESKAAIQTAKQRLQKQPNLTTKLL